MKQGTILLVEDDDDIRDGLQTILEYEGYDIRTAAHGKDALEQLTGSALPDLVLLDLMMPVMSGAELLEMMRRDPRLGTVPVVIVSAWPRQATSTLGAQGFLQKPIDIEALLDVAQRFTKTQAQQ